MWKNINNYKNDILLVTIIDNIKEMSAKSKNELGNYFSLSHANLVKNASIIQGMKSNNNYPFNLNNNNSKNVYKN